MEHTLSSPSVLSAAYSQRASAWHVVITGMMALLVTMDIDHFVFTSILSMMLHDGGLMLAQGSWPATSNYPGYSVGTLVRMAVCGGAVRLIRIDPVTMVLPIARMGVP